jgi:hypothetical protein
MQVHDIIVFVADESSEPGNGPEIDVVAYDERERFYVQRSALSIETSFRVRQEITLVSPFR